MSRFPRVNETFVLYEMIALEELGIPVEVYPLLRGRQRVVHPEAERLAKRARFQPFLSLSILYAHWYFIRRRPLAYFKLWAEILRGTWGSVNFFLGALGIFPKVVQFAYDMTTQGVTHVHAHFANHPAVAALIVHRLSGIPFSFTAHAHDLFVDQRMLDKKVAAAAFVVTISSYNQAFMVKRCGEATREKIHVIHCGVDLDLFLPSPRNVEDSPFNILCVAALEEKKGHAYLVEACHLLRERGVDFVCHLIGDGLLRREIEAQIVHLGLQNQIFIHGRRPRYEVAKLLSEADVVALASVLTPSGRREGIPVALMEAMASGLPVVSTTISGIPELVESGRTGLLVPPRHAPELAEALWTLQNDAAQRHRMGQAGREKILREFNLKTNAAALYQLIREHQVPSDGGTTSVFM